MLEKICKIIFLSKKDVFRGIEPADWSIKFNPLKETTPQATATLRKTIAETDKIYIETGVLDPAEVALSRFGGKGYSEEIELISDRNPADELGGGVEPEESETEVTLTEEQSKA